MNLRGAPDLMWAAFPQAQQPGGVVDLAVGENNAAAGLIVTISLLMKS